MNAGLMRLVGPRTNLATSILAIRISQITTPSRRMAGINFTAGGCSGQKRRVSIGSPVARINARTTCASDEALFSAIHSRKMATESAGCGKKRLMVWLPC